MEPSAEQPLGWAIRFADRARDDIRAAEEHFAETAGDDIAQAWAAGLLAEVAKLAQFPTIWPLAEEDRLFKQDIRRMLYRRTRRGPAYRVLFVLRRSLDDAPTVGIIHVRHSSRAPMTQQEAREMEGTE